MTEAQAIARARDMCERKGEDRYVVYEGGEYDECNAEDLDTFYAGTDPVFVADEWRA